MTPTELRAARLAAQAMAERIAAGLIDPERVDAATLDEIASDAVTAANGRHGLTVRVDRRPLTANGELRVVA